MKLKTATLIAIIGMSLYTLTHIFYFIGSLIRFHLAPIFWTLFDVMNLLAIVSLLLFFVVMYDKQK